MFVLYSSSKWLDFLYKTEQEEAAEQDGDGSGERTLFVKNLNFDTSEEDLRLLFTGVGPVRWVMGDFLRHASSEPNGNTSPTCARVELLTWFWTKSQPL